MKGANIELLVLVLLGSFRQCVHAVRAMASSSMKQKNRFNTKLPPFGSSVIEHYKSCGELRAGIKAALEIDFDKTIENELETSSCRDAKGGDGNFCRFNACCGGIGGTGGVGASGGGGGGVGGEGRGGGVGGFGGGGGGESSFVTNIQVEGVDAADTVKSDGTFIFSAYGREVVMTNLMGDTVDRVKISDEVASLLLDPVTKTITATSTKSKSNTRKYSSAAYLYSYKDGSLKLGKVIRFPGGYQGARSIGSKVHIISSLSLSRKRFSRCDATYEYMNDEQFEEIAFTVAKTVMPALVTEIMRDIGIEGVDDDCTNIARITSMTDADDDSTENEEDSALDLTDGRGLLQRFIRVTSFDMSVETENLVVESAGAFGPTNNIEVFSRKEFIVVAGRGYRRTRGQGRFNNYEEHTFLTGFEFQDKNCKVVPSAVGSVKGYLLDQFSMDFFEGILRVATTSFERWEYVRHEWRRVFQSSSQVSKLEFGEDGRMKLVGQLDKLGVTERISSVRLVRDRGYVVTFRQEDPLFVIDMVPDTPKLLGELKIAGFSNFLHPIGEEDQYLLGIGRQTNRLKISLFDVSDPTNPLEAQNRLVRGYSAFNFDFKAIRYLPISKKLILPLELDRPRSRNNFDGFILFDVDAENGIVTAGNVTHADNKKIIDRREKYCFSSNRLTPRSLVFDGNLVTLKGHSLIYSRGSDKLESDWELNLDEGRHRGRFRSNCHWYF